MISRVSISISVLLLYGQVLNPDPGPDYRKFQAVCITEMALSSLLLQLSSVADPDRFDRICIQLLKTSGSGSGS
jgi:hypothetical protein